jgi:hypothetical protein
VAAGDCGQHFVVTRESLFVLGVDNQVDQRGAGLGIAAGFPEFPEFLVDFANFNWQTGLDG